MSESVLVAEGLGKTYPLPKGELRVFEGLDFTLERGELVAVMGMSGVGKTTLLNLLVGLDRPSEGRVFLDGEDVFAGTDREVASVRNRKIGFVFQVYHLLPEFTSLENVSFPLMIGGVPRKDAFGRALEMLREVGLEDKASSRPGQLSGGEQQRVAIARSLVNNPCLLLADEPTG
ncbi:MAG: ABC transporter ATP-binding protein, partial [Candidatus Aminicenantes bacterium RBG_13_64_14]